MSEASAAEKSLANRVQERGSHGLIWRLKEAILLQFGVERRAADAEQTGRCAAVSNGVFQRASQRYPLGDVTGLVER